MYGSKDPTCPFFSVYSLTDVMDTANPDALVVSTKFCIVLLERDSFIFECLHVKKRLVRVLKKIIS